MPLGGVLGTRVGMNVGMGASRGRSNYVQHGSGLRVGRPVAATYGAAGGADDAIRDAMRAGQVAQQTRAASGASENPYIPPSPAAGEDPMKGVGKLGGGTMGLKPDFSDRDRWQKELEETAANPPGWLERQFDGDATYNDKLRALTLKRDWAEKKALEDAMQARATDPRYESWVDTKDTDEQGRRIQVSSQDPGRTRLKTFEEVYREEMEGPNRPGEYAPPTREATRRGYVVDPTIAGIKARAAEQKAASDRDFAEQQALKEAEHFARLQEHQAEAGLREKGALAEIRAREGAETRVATHRAGLKPEGEEAPRDVRADYDQLVRKKAGVQSAAGFDALPPEERAAAIKAADEELANRPTRDSLGGRKVGQVVAPKFKVGEVYRGRKFLGGDPNDLKSWGPPAGGGR